MFKTVFLSILATVAALAIGILPIALAVYLSTHSGERGVQFYYSAIGSFTMFVIFVISAGLGASFLLRSFRKIGGSETKEKIPPADSYLNKDVAEKIAGIIDAYRRGIIAPHEVIYAVRNEMKVFPPNDGTERTFSIKA